MSCYNVKFPREKTDKKVKRGLSVSIRASIYGDRYVSNATSSRRYHLIIYGSDITLFRFGSRLQESSKLNRYNACAVHTEKMEVSDLFLFFYIWLEFHITTLQRVIRIMHYSLLCGTHTRPGCVHSNSWQRISPGDLWQSVRGHCIAMLHNPDTFVQH